jgi:hypothetical protein
MISRGERKAQPQGKANRASIQRKRNRKEPALKSSVTITVTYGLPDASAEAFLSAANGVSQLGISSLTSKFVNTSSSIFKDAGSGGLRSFTESTGRITNFAELNQNDRETKAGALKNLDQLFRRTIEEEKGKGTSTAGINAKLNELSDTLKSKTGLSQLANYLEEKVSEKGAAASPETTGTLTGAASQNYYSGTFSQLA